MTKWIFSTTVFLKHLSMEHLEGCKLLTFGDNGKTVTCFRCPVVLPGNLSENYFTVLLVFDLDCPSIMFRSFQIP